MSVSAKELGWLLTQIVADSGETRDEAAEIAVDWETSMTDFQMRLVIRVLSLMATAEGPGPVRETQMNVMTDLFRPPYMTKADVAPLFEIPVSTLDDQDVDYLNGLLEALAEFPEVTTEFG